MPVCRQGNNQCIYQRWISGEFESCSRGSIHFPRRLNLTSHPIPCCPVALFSPPRLPPFLKQFHCSLALLVLWVSWLHRKRRRGDRNPLRGLRSVLRPGSAAGAHRALGSERRGSRLVNIHPVTPKGCGSPPAGFAAAPVILPGRDMPGTRQTLTLWPDE